MSEDQIKQQLDEHLTAINENTGEIQALFDYLQELDLKIEKLSLRLEQLQLVQSPSPERPTISSLTQIEKKIFLVLYTEELPLCYQEIAEKASLPASLIPECISSLISKGIPLLRSYFSSKLYLKLSPSFKELQAKQNVLNVSLQSFLS